MAYFINIGLLLILFILYQYEKINKKQFVIIATTQWILLSSLRHMSVGADTDSYWYGFINLSRFSISDIIIRFQDYSYYSGEFGKDPGYLLLVKLFQLISNDYRIFMVFVALIFTIPLGIWIYRNSEDVFISFIIYSCLFYSFYSITGYRQSIATALVVFIGYKFIKEKRLLPFTILSLIAFSIHKSSIVFYPFYFFSSFKFNKKRLIIYFSILLVIILFAKNLYIPLAEVIGYSDEYSIKGGTETYILFYSLIVILTLFRKNTFKESDRPFFNAVIIGYYPVLMTIHNQSFMRIQQYFTIFIILSVPKLINSFNKKDKMIIYYFTLAILLFLFLRTQPQYLFMWQQ